MNVRRAALGSIVPLLAATALGVLVLSRADAKGQAAPPASASASASGSTKLAFAKPNPCPAGMALVPGGTYTQGADKIGGEKKIASFCMDVTEVTVAAYATCEATGVCVPAWNTCVYPPWTAKQVDECASMCNAGKADRLKHPVNCVDFSQAAGYCAAVGKRLPEQDEWEWAARNGPKGTTFPWGEDPPDGRVCWSGPPVGYRTTTCTVGSYPSGDNAQGIHDLAGNLQEWTNTKWPGPDPLRITKGGTWAATNDAPLHVTNLNADPPLNRHNALGFRCVKDLS